MVCRPTLAFLLIAVPASAAEVFGPTGFGAGNLPHRGRSNFVFVGASMTDNENLTNGVNCLKSQASTTVYPAQLPAAPRLISATLYIAGSLIDESGSDPDGIFSNPSITFDNAVPTSPQSQAVEAAAKTAADTSVGFWPPGAAGPVTVSVAAGSANVSVNHKIAPEDGDFAFYVTAIDVTDVILDEGGGELAGVYSVNGLAADVCYGVEVACVDAANCTGATQPECQLGCAWTGVCEPATCVNTGGSAAHTNAGASFALLLVVDDPSLPLRSITRFTGLLALQQEDITENLDLQNPISTPAAGDLAFYALEGDLPLTGSTDGALPCGTNEFIEVDGDGTPASGGLCLSDDDNPVRNIFNTTINVQPGIPACAPATVTCCGGDGICGAVGVDIDRFDISSALTPGATQVRTTIGTGGDRVYLAALILGIDVFEPVLDADSQIRVLSATPNGFVRIGDDIVYSIAISNTGNITATNVGVVMDAPVRTSNLRVLSIPTGATDTSTTTGGANGNGVVRVQGFSLTAGEVTEIRVVLHLDCTPTITLTPQAQISATQISIFTVDAQEVITGGPGKSGSGCEGRDPNGPFSPPPGPPRDLRGGGRGCDAAGDISFAALLVMELVRRQKKRRPSP